MRIDREGGIGAVVLAAGQSRRMGQPKLVLPWGGRTVITHVAQTLIDAGAAPVVVVTGGARKLVEDALRSIPVVLVHNEAHDRSEMLVSLQVGMQALPKSLRAMLVVLGDQPLITQDIIALVIGAYLAGEGRIIVPSYDRRRGHPWLVDRDLWPALLALSEHQNMRDFLRNHEADIKYVTVSTPDVLKDMDTPEDYQSQHP